MAITLTLTASDTTIVAGDKVDFTIAVANNSEAVYLDALFLQSDKPGFILSPILMAGDQVELNGTRYYSASGYIPRLSQPWLTAGTGNIDFAIKAYATVDSAGTITNPESAAVTITVSPKSF